jgi:hypothetical protein
VVEAAAVIASFERPVLVDLVIPACNDLVLAIRFQPWHDRFLGA